MRPIIWGDYLCDAAATKRLKNWLKVKVSRLEEGQREREREKRRMRRANVDDERIQVANLMIWQIRARAH